MGSVTTRFYDDNLRVCQCKEGYVGRYCDGCDLDVENTGTEDEPICGCNTKSCR